MESNIDWQKRYSELQHEAMKEILRLQDKTVALQTKCDRYEKALKIVQKWQLPATGQFWDDDKTQPMSYGACYGSNGERDFMRNVANEALNGEGDRGVLKVGLKFRSKVAPLCSYEIVKIFPETKEFKVKETRECQVSGTTCHEVWSIEGFEKYYNLGVYYIQKEDKQ